MTARAGRLGVLIPVHNAPLALDRTLASVDAQSLPFDVIVVDDGSEPAVALDEGAYRHRLTVLRLPRNRGVAAALNTGLQYLLERDYELMARQDAGDLDLGDRLATQRAFLEAREEIALVGSWSLIVDGHGTPLRVERYPEDWAGVRRRLWYRSAFCHPATMMRTSVLRRVGLYRERYDLAEDYDLFCRIARTVPCANLPRVLVVREETGASITIARRPLAVRRRLAAQFGHFSVCEPHAYLGVLRTLAALPVGRRLARLLRQLRARRADLAR